MKEKQRSKLFNYVSVVILLSILFNLLFFTFPSTTQQESSTKSYTILCDRNLTHAINENTKTIEYSSKDTGEVINAVLEALPASGGKICIIAGNYSLLSTIILNKPCILEGEGSGRSYPGEGVTQLNFGNITGIKITSSGVRISHLQLKGAGNTATACYGIHLDASYNFLNQNINVEDVMIADTYYAIYGTGQYDIWDFYLCDVYINYCDQGIRIDKEKGAVQLQTNHIIITHAISDAVYLTHADAVILESIYFVEPGGNGIVIASFGSYPLMIRNCQIDECHENGILLMFKNSSSLWLTITDTQIKAYKSAIYMQNAQDVIVSNCNIATSQLSTSNQTIVYIEKGYRIQINNCLIKNLSQQKRNCIELKDSNYCHICNCHIDHSVGRAENIDFAIKETGTTSNNNQIVNNICVGISNGPAYTYGANSINEDNI
ncbi:MAG: hypothetical protein ACUVQX_04290 [Candidatus Bathycorpusculaceae bacterium]